MERSHYPAKRYDSSNDTPFLLGAMGVFVVTMYGIANYFSPTTPDFLVSECVQTQSRLDNRPSKEALFTVSKEAQLFEGAGEASSAYREKLSELAQMIEDGQSSWDQSRQKCVENILLKNQ